MFLIAYQLYTRNWFNQKGFSFFLFCGCIKEKIDPW